MAWCYGHGMERSSVDEKEYQSAFIGGNECYRDTRAPGNDLWQNNGESFQGCARKI